MGKVDVASEREIAGHRCYECNNERGLCLTVEEEVTIRERKRGRRNT